MEATMKRIVGFLLLLFVISILALHPTFAQDDTSCDPGGAIDKLSSVKRTGNSAKDLRNLIELKQEIDKALANCQTASIATADPVTATPIAPASTPVTESFGRRANPVPLGSTLLLQGNPGSGLGQMTI